MTIKQPTKSFKPRPIKFRAAQHLAFVDPMAETFAFQIFDDNKDRKDVSRARTIVGTFDDAWPRLVAANEDGCGVYVTVNRTKGNRRRAKDVDLVRYHFVEIDGGSTLEQILAKPFKPAWINESSPGKYHVYFNVAPDVQSDLAGFTPRQTLLAMLYGGGRESKDLPRVLRLAGFVHRKGEPFLVRNVYSDDRAPLYTIADFANVLGEIEPVAATIGERSDEPAAQEDASAIEVVTAYFQNEAPIAISDTVNEETGVQGNDTAYRVMVSARDMGVEQSTCLDLALEFYNPRCEPEWPLAQLETIVANAYNYAQNTQGKDSAAADFADDPLDETETIDPKKAEKIEAGKASRKKSRENFGVDYVQGSEVKIKTIDWIWEGHLALGQHTCIAGVQGDGKSQLVYALAAAVTTGGKWPGSDQVAPIGNVILLNAEDTPDDVMVPRLKAAGADMTKVFIVQAITESNGKRRKFNLQADLDRLTKLAEKIGNVKLITFDPVSSYLGGELDSHENVHLRDALDPITEMAFKTGAAVISVTHFNKSSKGVSALNRVMGGAGFTAAPRAAFAVIRDAKNDEIRMMLSLKSNLAAKGAAYGICFTVAAKVVGTDERNDRDVSAPYVVWGAKTTMTADEALNAANELRKGPSKQDIAEEFLTRLLGEGPELTKVVEAKAKKREITLSTLRLAREALGIVVTKRPQRDGRGPWEWSLPEELRAKGDDNTNAPDPAAGSLPGDETADEPDFGFEPDPIADIL